MACFNLSSFNLHGLNHGHLLLENMCNDLKLDVIMIQEHWLSPDSLYKLCELSCNYVMIGISAMSSAVSNSVLVGRPFGGCAILVKDCYKQRLITHKTGKRFVIISIGRIAVVNLYLPNYRSVDDLGLINDLFSEVLLSLENIS